MFADEMDLKAAFIYNFTLFTTWPEPKQNLMLCVLGDERFLAQLSKFTGQKSSGTTIHVQKIYGITEAQSCDVLFIDRNEHFHSDQVHKTLEKLPVLTIGESGMADHSGVMILLVRDQNRIAFEIDQNAAVSAGLTLSYKLLKLARKVK